MPTDVNGTVFTKDEIRDMLGPDFNGTLSDAEAGSIGLAIEGSVAAYMLMNYMIFNPVKEEMDQILSPMNN